MGRLREPPAKGRRWGRGACGRRIVTAPPRRRALLIGRRLTPVWRSPPLSRHHDRRSGRSRRAARQRREQNRNRPIPPPRSPLRGPNTPGRHHDHPSGPAHARPPPRSPFKDAAHVALATTISPGAHSRHTPPPRSPPGPAGAANRHHDHPPRRLLAPRTATTLALPGPKHAAHRHQDRPRCPLTAAPPPPPLAAGADLAPYLGQLYRTRRDLTHPRPSPTGHPARTDRGQPSEPRRKHPAGARREAARPRGRLRAGRPAGPSWITVGGVCAGCWRGAGLT